MSYCMNRWIYVEIFGLIVGDCVCLVDIELFI